MLRVRGGGDWALLRGLKEFFVVVRRAGAAVLVFDRGMITYSTVQPCLLEICGWQVS